MNRLVLILAVLAVLATPLLAEPSCPQAPSPLNDSSASGLQSRSGLALAAVPEPAALTLVILGAAGMVMRRRRRP